jgi:hypothetical protein
VGFGFVTFVHSSYGSDGTKIIGVFSARKSVIIDSKNKGHREERKKDGMDR